MNTKDVAFALNRMTIELNSPFASTRNAAPARAAKALEDAGVDGFFDRQQLIAAAKTLNEFQLVVSHA